MNSSTTGQEPNPIDLATALVDELGEGFSVFVASDYVVVGHAALGLAAVAAGDEAKAINAADRLNAMAEKAGVAYPSMHFAIGDVGRSQWVIPHSGMGAAIIRAMATASISRPPFGQEALSKIAIAMSELPQQDDDAILDWRIMRTIEACVDRALGGRQSFVAGLEIEAADVAGPKFLLPALLVGAAKNWTLPVIASKGAGGFLIRLKKDESAILGYRVADIEMSSPLLLFLPIVNLVRTSFVGNECSFDSVVEEFARFLKDNRYNASGIDDLDVKVATSA
jgi:hypothetical protein